MAQFRLSFLIPGALLLAGCSGSDKPTPAPAAAAPAPPDPVKITQFYATVPNLSRGEKELICYGVENGKTVFLSPPKQELSAALSRCVEVTPTATTTYTLTAEGAAGPPATRELTVTVGPARVKIIDVTVSALTVKPGDLVSLCFHARNATSVEISPLHFRARNPNEGCATDTPRQTTNYVVSATGAAGSKDQEHVTVTVK
jgi:hypothetical protein